MSDSSIDLLAPKRVELGLPPVQSPLQPTGRLLAKGGAVSVCLLAVAAIAVFMTASQEKRLNDSVVELTPYANQSDQLEAKLATVRSSTAVLKSNVTSITQRLVSIRSGSAFFEQLKRVTPSSVQLRNVSVGTNQVMIQGLASQSIGTVGPLEQINSFALNLEGLAGVQAEGAVLTKSTRSNDGSVQFDLRVNIDPSHTPTADELMDLGAEGLARRHQWLSDRGLPL